MVLSGNAYAKAFKQQADARLAAAVAPASRSRMLKAVRELEVVEHGRSQNYCAHLRRNARHATHSRQTFSAARTPQRRLDAHVWAKE